MESLISSICFFSYYIKKNQLIEFIDSMKLVYLHAAVLNDVAIIILIGVQSMTSILG